jgi:arylsulfatase A-like enzyme
MLRSLDLLSKTVIIISSDHGELLGQDGFVGHGFSLHDNLIHVPLIMYTEIPSLLPKKTHIDHLVEEIDLAPTILDLCGIEYDETQFDGESLINLLEHDKWEKKSVYSEFVRKKENRFYASLRNDRYKLVWDAAENYFSLFDLKNDIAEKEDQSQKFPEITDQMKKEMLDLTGRKTFPDLRPKIIDKLDKDTEEQMRALGYIK